MVDSNQIEALINVAPQKWGVFKMGMFQVEQVLNGTQLEKMKRCGQGFAAAIAKRLAALTPDAWAQSWTQIERIHPVALGPTRDELIHEALKNGGRF